MASAGRALTAALVTALAELGLLETAALVSAATVPVDRFELLVTKLLTAAAIWAGVAEAGVVPAGSEAWIAAVKTELSAAPIWACDAVAGSIWLALSWAATWSSMLCAYAGAENKKGGGKGADKNTLYGFMSSIERPVYQQLTSSTSMVPRRNAYERVRIFLAKL